MAGCGAQDLNTNLEALEELRCLRPTRQCMCPPFRARSTVHQFHSPLVALSHCRSSCPRRHRTRLVGPTEFELPAPTLGPLDYVAVSSFGGKLTFVRVLRAAFLVGMLEKYNKASLRSCQPRLLIPRQSLLASTLQQLKVSQARNGRTHSDTISWKAVSRL